MKLSNKPKLGIRQAVLLSVLAVLSACKNEKDGIIINEYGTKENIELTIKQVKSLAEESLENKTDWQNSTVKVISTDLSNITVVKDNGDIKDSLVFERKINEDVFENFIYKTSSLWTSAEYLVANTGEAILERKFNGDQNVYQTLKKMKYYLEKESTEIEKEVATINENMQQLIAYIKNMVNLENSKQKEIFLVGKTYESPVVIIHFYGEGSAGITKQELSVKYRQYDANQSHAIHIIQLVDNSWRAIKGNTISYLKVKEIKDLKSLLLGFTPLSPSEKSLNFNDNGTIKSSTEREKAILQSQLDQEKKQRISAERQLQENTRSQKQEAEARAKKDKEAKIKAEKDKQAEALNQGFQSFIDYVVSKYSLEAKNPNFGVNGKGEYLEILFSDKSLNIYFGGSMIDNEGEFTLIRHDHYDIPKWRFNTEKQGRDAQTQDTKKIEQVLDGYRPVSFEEFVKNTYIKREQKNKQ